MPRGLEEIAVRIGRIWYHDRVRRMAFSETVPGGEVGRAGCQDFAGLTAGVLPALLVHRLLRQEQSAGDTPGFTHHPTPPAGNTPPAPLCLPCHTPPPPAPLAAL